MSDLEKGQRCGICGVSLFRAVVISAIMTVFTIIILWEREAPHNCLVPSPSEYNPQPIIKEIVHAATAACNKSQPQQTTDWDYNWDKGSQNVGDSKQGQGGFRTIILIRHGQYELNTGKLNEKGRIQANLTGLRLSQLQLGDLTMIHSTLDRAAETARIIHQYFSQVAMGVDDMLCEGGPIQPKPTIGYWGLPERDYYKDGPRLEAAFRKYFFRPDVGQKSQSVDILIGHGNIFRFFVLRALQLPPEAWMRIFIGHGSITKVNINSDGVVSLFNLGDTGHIPPHLLSY